MNKILIVDDAAFVRMQYSKSLIEGGYDVEEASNGAEAIEKYKLTNPDAVLLDINMPIIDGIGTLHEILNFDPSAKIIMVSCIGVQSIVLSAMKSGARDFIIKPTEKESLLNKVEKLLSTQMESIY